ncbi:MAG: HD domain-containing phosphohydrolase [Planctomycetota bacterium]
MLLCPLDDLRPGMTVGASIMHPERPTMELLRAQTALDERMIRRLADMGVSEAWVDASGTEDLDLSVMGTELTDAQRKLFTDLSGALGKTSRKTLSSAQIGALTGAVGGFVSQIVANKTNASLTSRLRGGDDPLFAHCSSVAYLSVLTGLAIEEYVIEERASIANVRHAKDLTGLGLAGMLHDVGKTTLPPKLRDTHEVNLDPNAFPPEYEDHTIAGYQLLDSSTIPASAKLAVLLHHERVDGSGWPQASKLGSRFSETPDGTRLHVFARILAAANVLDNLLRKAESLKQPPIVALHAFQGERFTGWFDPVIRGAMLRQLPPFAVGTKVGLDDGRDCVVVRPNPEYPCRPVVRPLGGDASTPVIDLSLQPDRLVARASGHPVDNLLYELDADDSEWCRRAA